MTSVEDLARTIRDAANAGLRVAQGTVVAVVDTTHVSVDLGDRVITAYRPGSVPAGEGAGVRVCIRGRFFFLVHFSSCALGGVPVVCVCARAHVRAGTQASGCRLVAHVLHSPRPPPRTAS